MLQITLIFDHLLIERYPKYTFFRLRQIKRLIRESVKGRGAPTTKVKQENNPVGSRFRWLRDVARRIYRSWHHVFPNPYGGKTSEIIAGEVYGVEVSTIAFPEGEGRYELRGTTLPELLSLIENRFGSPSMRKPSIHGIDWLVIDVGSLAESE